MQKKKMTISATQIENLIYDLIYFFQRWGIWGGIEIRGLGKIYSPEKKSEKDLQFRNMINVWISPADSDWNQQEKGSLLEIFIGGTQMHSLLEIDEFYAVLEACSDDVRDYIIEKEDLLDEWFSQVEEWEAIPGEGRILDNTDFDSYDEYLEFEEELESELLQDIMDDLYREESVYCHREIREKIYGEFKAIFKKHNTVYRIEEDLSDVLACYQDSFFKSKK